MLGWFFSGKTSQTIIQFWGKSCTISDYHPSR